MNRAIFLLTASLLAFASSTAYLMARVHVQSEKLATLRERIHDLEELGRAHAVVSASAVEQLPEGHALESKALVPNEVDKVDALIAGAPAEPTVEEVNLALDIGLRLKQEQLLRDPKYRAARLESEKQTQWLINAEAISALHLSPKVADQLMELLAEHQLQSIEQPVAVPPGQDYRALHSVDLSNPPVWYLKRRQEEQRRAAEIEMLLGTAKYREWTAVNHTASARHEVALLATALETSGDPLRADQRKALVNSIAEEGRQTVDARKAQGPSIFGPSNEASHLAMLEDNVERVAQSNERLRRLAASYLSSQQLDIYEAALDRKLARSRAQLNVHRARMEALGGTQDDGP